MRRRATLFGAYLPEPWPLALVMSHLFSLALMREIFGKQVQQNKGPQPILAAAGNA